jgi:hypothetical protein
MKIIPEDIQSEVLKRFAPIDHRMAFEILVEIGEIRLMRCAIHSSNGDLEKLLRALETARKDFRDLIFSAEYDKSEMRIWDFNMPFPQARLPR